MGLRHLHMTRVLSERLRPLSVLCLQKGKLLEESGFKTRRVAVLFSSLLCMVGFCVA